MSPSTSQLRLIMMAILTSISTIVSAEVRLPAIIGSRMVLQRDMPLPIWGWAEPDEEVTVSIAEQKHIAVTSESGKWQVTLDPLHLGNPLSLVVAGKTNQVEINDLLVGDVWLCSGQSNMKWSVKDSWNADLEIPKANQPQIRLITIEGLGSQEPVETSDAEWEVCSPKSVRNFSAVGYHFGLELQERLGVPIGLIDNAWGGSACEAWVRLDHMENDPLYASLLRRWQKIATEYDVEKEEAAYKQARSIWKEQVSAAQKEGKPIPSKPRWENPLTGKHRPANLYNGRIMPVMPLGIRGVIWYQGETNAARASQYRELFPLMIRTWREAWGQGNFPFYWVQLADYKNEQKAPQESDWAELREAQTLTLDREPNTGQAVIIDLGESKDIHPREKMEVARRLTRLALANEYGIKIDHASPRFESMAINDNKAIVTFKDCGPGLRTIDKREVLGFDLAGKDQKWHRAKAEIVDSNRVVITSKAVLMPVAIRYAWADNPVCNLYTQTGLPVTPFRTTE